MNPPPVPGWPTLDRADRQILALITQDATLSLAEISRAVGLTQTPCWKRIRRMEQGGVILRRVAIVDQASVGLPISAFVGVATADHSSSWLAEFARVLGGFDEVIDAWRMAGDVDYLLHVVVADMASYDNFYRKLITALPLRNVTTRFAMERLKTSPLPLIERVR